MVVGRTVKKPHSEFVCTIIPLLVYYCNFEKKKKPNEYLMSILSEKRSYQIVHFIMNSLYACITRISKAKQKPDTIVYVFIRRSHFRQNRITLSRKLSPKLLGFRYENESRRGKKKSKIDT